MVARNHDLSDCPTRPEKETARPHPYGVLTHRAEESFVCLSVLLQQRLWLREGNRANEVNQKPRHRNQEAADQDVFEVPDGEILMHHQSDPDQRRRAKGKEQREIDACILLDENDRRNNKNRQQDRQLEESKLQMVFFAESVELLSGRFPLPFHFLVSLRLFTNKPVLPLQQVRDGLTQLLIFSLIIQKKVQAAREVRLFGLRKGNAFFQAEFPEFDELVNGLLQIARTVPHDPLFLGFVFNLSS